MAARCLKPCGTIVASDLSPGLTIVDAVRILVPPLAPRIKSVALSKLTSLMRKLRGSVTRKPQP